LVPDNGEEAAVYLLNLLGRSVDTNAAADCWIEDKIIRFNSPILRTEKGAETVSPLPVDSEDKTTLVVLG
jgi:hypothetical protein